MRRVKSRHSRLRIIRATYHSSVPVVTFKDLTDHIPYNLRSTTIRRNLDQFMDVRDDNSGYRDISHIGGVQRAFPIPLGQSKIR